MSRSIARLNAAVLFTFIIPTAAYAQLSLSFEDDYFVVENMTAGGSVAVLGVVHEFPGITVHVSSPYFLGTDSDGDASVTIAFDEPISPCSVFTAVDLMTGSSVLMSPQETRLRECGGNRDLMLTPFTKFSNSELEIGGHLVTVMVVRPGVGVWRTQVGDGGPSDADRTHNGKILLEAESLAREDNPIPPPADYLSGDIVVVIGMLTRQVTMRVLDGDLNPKFAGTS